MSHNDDFQHFEVFIFKVVLLQNGKTFTRAHMDIAGLRLQLTG